MREKEFSELVIMFICRNGNPMTDEGDTARRVQGRESREISRDGRLRIHKNLGARIRGAFRKFLTGVTAKFRASRAEMCVPDASVINNAERARA